MTNKHDSARERNKNSAAQRRGDADQRKTFGRRRGQWLDQVFDDPKMTGDSCRVMYAISRCLDTATFTCSYGDPAIAERAHVSTKTVQRARQLARVRGHTKESFHGHRCTVITPILHSEEGGQIVHVDAPEGGQFVQVNVDNLSTQHGQQHGQQRGHLDSGSPVESMGSAPISHISHFSHISQEKKEEESLLGAQEEDSRAARVVDVGRRIESAATTSESVNTGTKRESAETAAAKKSESDGRKESKMGAAKDLARATPATNGAGSAFKEFWAQYPLKKAKFAAQREFERAVKSGTSPQEIIAGAMRYAAERDGKDPKFTKYPTTWLKGGCWEDEASPPARQQNRNPGVAALLKMAGGGHE